MTLCRAVGAGEDQEGLLLPLVLAVQARLKGRLREGVLPEDCGLVFSLAAAMLAVEELSGLTGGGAGGVTSFTAGDLTIRRENGGESKSLSGRAESLLSPWMKDSRFCFQEVEG